MSKPEFSFVPRKVSKSSKAVADSHKTRAPSSYQHSIQSERVGTSPSVSEEKKGKFLDDSACASLFMLALSDYALWSNAELLEAMEASEEGFVAISYLLRISRAFAGLSAVPPEAILIRCIKSSSALEGRIMISETAPRKTGAGTQGGYEVRRRDWSQVRGRIRKYTSYHWDSRTIYVENLPFRARTCHAVYEFVHQLLPRESDSEPSAFALQSVSFPPHEKDNPDAPPTVGKGFAFIILSRTKDVDCFLHRWPWNPDDRPITLDTEDEEPSVVREAMDLGFRCLSKREWDTLKEDYLALQRRLLERTLVGNTPGPSTGKRTQPDASLQATPRRQDGVTSAIEAVARADEPSAWFPRDCLVFVKNVHSETNKTTLRTLLSSAFNKDAVPIDYVDYNKGLDSCYLRLSAPQHARTLVSYFSEHKMAQTDALDNEGASTTGSFFIEMVLVQGKREEMYWEKVPEKIRKAAIASAQGKTDDVSMRGQKGGSGAGNERKRKRRKHE